MKPTPQEHNPLNLAFDYMLEQARAAAERIQHRIQKTLQRFPELRLPNHRKRTSYLTRLALKTRAAQESSMRVLIVEDNVDSAESLAIVLRLWGFETEVAYDGPTALELARRTRPDAILTDIGLPGMDGFELAQQLFANAELRGIPIAAVTAYMDEDSRQRSKNLGFVKHFGKPTDLAALHRLLDDERQRHLEEQAQASAASCFR